MGFSSFGAKPNPPKKKRKLLDPSADGSGSNNTPLGVRIRNPRAGGEVGGRAMEEAVGMGTGMGMGMEMGRMQGQEQKSELQERQTVSHTPATSTSNRDTRTDIDTDTLDAAARDETAAMLLETGLLPQYLDRSTGGSGERGDGEWGWGHERGDGEWEGGGKRGDGEWDWRALRTGVRDQRGDVAFYDASFVEDPWRGLRGEGRKGEKGG